MTRVAVVGDYNDSVTAHVAIEASLFQLAAAAEGRVAHEWVPTPDAEFVDFTEFDGVWCAPASPYASERGALRAITHARTTDTPFFGSCGGYQHAVLEIARNELGLINAENTEVNPDAAVPLICGLSCSLVEVHDTVLLLEGSQIAALVGQLKLDAAYHCSFGVNRKFLPRFGSGPITFTGFDTDGDLRAFEHVSHPFFIGTAFQPERAALDGAPHPLVSAFVAACELHRANRH